LTNQDEGWNLGDQECK